MSKAGLKVTLTENFFPVNFTHVLMKLMKQLWELIDLFIMNLPPSSKMTFDWTVFFNIDCQN